QMDGIQAPEGGTGGEAGGPIEQLPVQIQLVEPAQLPPSQGDGPGTSRGDSPNNFDASQCTRDPDKRTMAAEGPPQRAGLLFGLHQLDQRRRIDVHGAWRRDAWNGQRSSARISASRPEASSPKYYGGSRSL